MTRAPSSWLVLLSLLAGWIVLVLPLPSALMLLRPYLLALVLCYWLLETPELIGLGSAFVIGLVADAVSGTLLGEQAMRLVILAFLVQRFRARLRFFPLWQQAAAVFALLLNDRVVVQAIRWVSGEGLLPWPAWFSPLLGFALWPWLFLLLDQIRLRRRERGN